jgi:hypothetical protein
MAELHGYDPTLFTDDSEFESRDKLVESIRTSTSPTKAMYLTIVAEKRCDNTDTLRVVRCTPDGVCFCEAALSFHSSPGPWRHTTQPSSETLLRWQRLDKLLGAAWARRHWHGQAGLAPRRTRRSGSARVARVGLGPRRGKGARTSQQASTLAGGSRRSNVRKRGALRLARTSTRCTHMPKFGCLGL